MQNHTFSQKFSKFTVVLVVALTALAACGSDSETRMKNTTLDDGSTCYTDKERSDLLVTAVAIPSRAAVEYQPAVAAIEPVSARPAVLYQAARKATEEVPAIPAVPAVEYRAAIEAQPAVPEVGGRWTRFHEGLMLEVSPDEVSGYNNPHLMVSRGEAEYQNGNTNNVVWHRGMRGYYWISEVAGQPAVPAQPEVKAQEAIPGRDAIPAGAEVPEILAQDAVEAQDGVPAQDEVMAQEAFEGVTLDQVQAKIYAVKACEEEVVVQTTVAGPSWEAEFESTGVTNLGIVENPDGGVTLSWENPEVIVANASRFVIGFAEIGSNGDYVQGWNMHGEGGINGFEFHPAVFEHTSGFGKLLRFHVSAISNVCKVDDQWDCIGSGTTTDDRQMGVIETNNSPTEDMTNPAVFDPNSEASDFSTTPVTNVTGTANEDGSVTLTWDIPETITEELHKVTILWATIDVNRHMTGQWTDGYELYSETSKPTTHTVEASYLDKSPSYGNSFIFWLQTDSKGCHGGDGACKVGASTPIDLVQIKPTSDVVDDGELEPIQLPIIDDLHGDPVTEDDYENVAPPILECIWQEDLEAVLAGIDSRIAHTVGMGAGGDSERQMLLARRENMAARDVCDDAGEVNPVIFTPLDDDEGQDFDQVVVPSVVYVVEQPVLLISEVVTEVVVGDVEISDVISAAGFTDGVVEVQVEDDSGLSDWLMIEAGSSNVVGLSATAKSIKVRVTSSDITKPVYEKTVRLSRLAVSTRMKQIEVAFAEVTEAATAVEETAAEESSNQIIYILVATALVILIGLGLVARRKKASTTK